MFISDENETDFRNVKRNIKKIIEEIFNEKIVFYFYENSKFENYCLNFISSLKGYSNISCIYVIMPTNCRLSSLVVVIRIFTVTESCPSCVLLMSACIIMQSSVRNIAFIYHCPYLYAQDDEQI